MQKVPAICDPRVPRVDFTSKVGNGLFEGLGTLLKAFQEAPERDFGISGPYRGHERAWSKDFHPALQIIGEHMQRHLGRHLFQRLRQEVGVTHPGFERPEGVLRGFSANPHRLRVFIKPPLDGFENMLVLPSCDPPLNP